MPHEAAFVFFVFYRFRWPDVLAWTFSSIEVSRRLPPDRGGRVFTDVAVLQIGYPFFQRSGGYLVELVHADDVAAIR